MVAKLVRILGANYEIEDLTQEVFFRTLTRLDRLENPEALGAFMTSIAVVVAREKIRARRRARERAPGWFPASRTTENLRRRSGRSAPHSTTARKEAETHVRNGADIPPSHWGLRRTDRRRGDGKRLSCLERHAPSSRIRDSSSRRLRQRRQASLSTRDADQGVGAVTVCR